MQRYGYIYKITNTINNKVYIGQHKWDGDGLDPNYFCSSNNPHFWNSINKYGTDNFKLELIQHCTNKSSLDIMEMTWISYYRRVLGHDNVYNISKGGNSGWDSINGYKLLDREYYNELRKNSWSSECQEKRLATNKMKYGRANW